LPITRITRLIAPKGERLESYFIPKDKLVKRTKKTTKREKKERRKE